MGSPATMRRWQRTSAASSGAPRWLGRGSLWVALLLPLLPPAAFAEPPTVYRCVAAGGSIEFRQYPCHERDAAKRIAIEDRRTGWVPPKPPAGSSQAKDEHPTKPAMVERDPALADRCWKKQRQLDDVNRRLRAGYTPDQGVRLRQRRGDYEAYLRRFCSP